MKPCLFCSLDSFVSFRAAYPLVWDQQVLWETCTLNTLLWDDFASFPVREIPFCPGTRFYRFYSFSLLESSFISFVVINGYFLQSLVTVSSCQCSCCILAWPISFTPFGSYASLLLLSAHGLRSAGAPRITHSSHRAPRTLEGLVSPIPFVWVSSHYIAIRFRSDAIVRV